MKESFEAELWGRALDGDPISFAELFDRHRDRLFRSALRSAPSAVDAEDAVASAFLELWRRRNDVRLVEGSVLPWLLTTTHNITRNLLRHQRRHRVFLAKLPPADSVPSAEESSVEVTERFERQRQVATVLGRLSRADAEILTLVGLEEITLSQAAATLGISYDAAKQRFARARRRARAIGQAVVNAPRAAELGEIG
jgi:RNA polymerase sigma-70 factor (ECF subfamily)